MKYLKVLANQANPTTDGAGETKIYYQKYTVDGEETKQTDFAFVIAPGMLGLSDAMQYMEDNSDEDIQVVTDIKE
jgi:hypothetical protein